MKEEGWWEFIDLLMHAKRREEMDALLDVLLTPEEIESFGKRCLIFKALLEGKLPQREIAESLGVSFAKITRGSNALKIAQPEAKKYLEKRLVKP